MGWRVEIKLPDCAPEAKPNLIDLGNFHFAQRKETFKPAGLKVRNDPPRNPGPRGADGEPTNTLTSAFGTKKDGNNACGRERPLRGSYAFRRHGIPRDESKNTLVVHAQNAFHPNGTCLGRAGLHRQYVLTGLQMRIVVGRIGVRGGEHDVARS